MLPAIIAFTLLAVLLIGLLIAGSLFVFIWTRAVPLALAILGGLAASTMLDGDGPTTGTTIIISLALFVLLESARTRMARRRALRSRYDIDITPTPAARPAKRPAPTRLDRSFDALAVEADWARSRLAVAHGSCRLFLAATDLAGPGSEAADFAPRVHTGIPERIELSLRTGRVVSAMERRVILDECIADIEHVAAEADRLRAHLQPALRNEMRLQSQYLRHKTPPDPFAVD